MSEDLSNRKGKMPGMAYILVSFIPWIIYWVSCGLGYRLGVFLSYIISFAITAPQVRSRNLFLMDFISLVYFCLAFIGTFIFNLNSFVQYSGFIGYLVLFLMAATSVIVKSPFTFKVSKRDWPEVYWKEESFLFINNVISAFWTFIFLVNACTSLSFYFAL